MPRRENLVEVTSLGQALTANLLRRANSALLGGRAQITTVRGATVRLGTSVVVSMALASSVSRRMQNALPAYGLAEGELWSHLVPASVAAVSLAQAMVPDMLRAADALPTDDRVPVFESHLGVMLKLGLDPAEYPVLLMAAREKYAALAERYDVDAG